jgi:VanZ family protein
MLGNALGIGMEFVQKYWIPFRDFDTEDIIADMIGAGLAYGVSNIYFLKSV